MDDLLIRHKLDVDEYQRMAEAGILHEDDRVELIDGEIIDMAPIGSDHAGTVNGLNRALVLSCGERAIVSVQNPVRLDRLNEPEPDFALLRPRPDFYRGAHPGASDVLLLVEVSDTSLRFDRRVKLPLYARFGIPEVWIVDLHARVLEAHSGPANGAYTQVRTCRPADVLALSAAPDIELELAFAFG